MIGILKNILVFVVGFIPGSLFHIGLAWGQTSIAVFDFENNGIKYREVRQLTTRLESELVKIGDFRVVERTQIDDLLKEQKLQLSGCVEECLIDVGKMLGAKQVVMGSVGEMGGLITLSAKLVDAESGELIRTSNYNAVQGLRELIISGLNIVALELANKKIPSRPKQNSWKNSIEKAGIAKEIDEAEANLALLAVEETQIITAPRKEISKMVVTAITICKNVEKRQPIGSNIIFDNYVDSLYCFTRIQNKGGKSEVRHVWYYNDTPITQFKYNVKRSNSYRSWTKNTISPKQVGEWYVEIQTKNGELLERKYFYVAYPEKIEEHKILEQFKKITNKEHAGNVKAAYKSALNTIDASKKDILSAVKKTMMMDAVEQWINKNPNGKATDFPRTISAETFNQIKNNNIIAEFLIRNKASYNALDDLIRRDQIFFNNPIKGYDFSSINKLTYDLTELLNNSNDNKKYLTAITEINLIKQNYNFILHFYNMDILDEQRPLLYPLR